MRATEHAKLTRLLSNIEYLGDVGKAAVATRVSRSLLDKWMNMPGVSWKINTALNEAQAMLRCGDTAEDILFRAKVLPKLHKDAAVFQATGKRHREFKSGGRAALSAVIFAIFSFRAGFSEVDLRDRTGY